VDKVLERIRELKDEDSRYAYADAVTNAFLTGQIKALREERNLTQEQLADLVGTQQSGISRWLNSGFSTCKVDTLRKFARAYGVRLRISFEPFGTLPTDVRGFTKERLAPRKFEDDPAFKEPPKEEIFESVAATSGCKPGFENALAESEHAASMLNENLAGALSKASEGGNYERTARKGMTRALEPIGNHPIEELAA
jgi:transcriptional regulator with XRE-family HTH domain